jgi:hypothetical protein
LDPIHQVFLKGTSYSVHFGAAGRQGNLDESPGALPALSSHACVQIDGSELAWGRGLPPATAKMFAQQVFSEGKIKKDTSKKGVVVPVTPEGPLPPSIDAPRRLGVAELVDILSPDLCSFKTLREHVAAKHRRKENKNK